ncbi:MAG TPA: YdcF family protein [Candidatus Peribacteraceae bacterium]|nr:YdcF family protein [Candidatus Peribacteraceae bacterium]
MHVLSHLLLRIGLILAALALFFVLVLLAAIGIVEAHFQGDARLPADCALVFGAAVYASTQPGPAIVRRVETAANLYRSHQVNRLILSGGRGEGNIASEAEVMQKQAIDDGVSASDITLEDQSHSTLENLLYSQNLTSRCKSVVGISDAYHLARIALLADRLGWKNFTTYPSDIRPDRGSENRSVLREAVAYLYYAFYVDAWIPTEMIQKHLQLKFRVPFFTGREVSIARTS